MTKTQANRLFKVIFGLLKTICILVGLPISVICLMSAVGIVSGNGWIRLGVALILGIGVPIFLADRLLPEDSQQRSRGLVTDILALCWLGLPFLFAGVGHQWTRGMLLTEGDRQSASRLAQVALVTYTLAGVKPVPTVAGHGARADLDPARTTAKAKGSTATSKAATSKGTKPPTKPADSGPATRADAGPSDSASPSTKYTPAELFAKFSPSVVNIKVTSGPMGMGGGTGFLIDAKGTIVTNSHVIHKSKGVQVKLKAGDWVKKVYLLAEDEEADLALLRIPASKLPEPLSLADSNIIKVGEHLVSIGNPLGLEHTLTDGLVSARRMLNGRKWIQMSTPISPGNSGGPIFNMRGEVVGVTTAAIGGMFMGAQNLNLAVPINELKKMIKGKYPKQRSIGADDSQTW